MSGLREWPGLRVGVLLAALLAAGCTIISKRRLDWEQVQAAGGVRVLDPVEGTSGRVLLPLDFDESGLTEVTSRPTALDSFAVALDPEVNVSGHDIHFTIVVGDGKGRPGSVHAPPIVVRDLEPGIYRISYKDPDGKTWTPLRTVQIGTPREAQRSFDEVQGSRFRALIVPGAEVPGSLMRDIGSTGFWEPAPADVLCAEARIVDAIDLMLHQPDATPADLAPRGMSREIVWIGTHLTEYRAQVVGITVEGHRRLYFNVYREWDFEEFDDGRHGWVAVEDGGADYWRIQYDLDADRCLDFDSNGYA